MTDHAPYIEAAVRELGNRTAAGGPESAARIARDEVAQSYLRRRSLQTIDSLETSSKPSVVSAFHDLDLSARVLRQVPFAAVGRRYQTATWLPVSVAIAAYAAAVALRVPGRVANAFAGPTALGHLAVALGAVALGALIGLPLSRRPAAPTPETFRAAIAVDLGRLDAAYDALLTRFLADHGLDPLPA